MTLQSLTPDMLACLNNDQLIDISLGLLVVSVTEESQVSEMLLRARRDKLREAGENTIRLDAEIEHLQRMKIDPMRGLLLESPRRK